MAETDPDATAPLPPPSAAATPPPDSTLLLGAPSPSPAPALLALSSLREHETERTTARFERLDKLGQGGMAIVWRARDRKLGREVALKELREELELHEGGVARFRREAEAIARLSHPHVVAFFDVVEESSRLSLIMELVRGGSLAELLARERAAGRRDVRALVALVEKVARGIQHAHEQGVLHRDLKPSNVLVTVPDAPGGAGEPKVTDFGLAQLAGSATLTRTGELLGTPAYMAPEQARGHEVDARTDVHALGAILYEVLTGRPPFTGDSMAALLQKVQTEEPAPPRALDDRIHVDLETVALRCLSKEPERRYQRAGDVADELARFLRGESILARPPGTLERASVWSRRNRRGLVAGTALLLGALALGATFLARLEDEWRRRSVVEQAIAAALDPGTKDDDHAVDRVVSAGDPGAVALLGSALDVVSRHLAAASRAVYALAKMPREDEARAGAIVIDDLDEALDQRLRGPLSVQQRGAIEAATRRIERRWERDRAARPTDAAPARADRILAAAQDEAVGPGERRLARLACESLARLGRREAVPCLGRYLAVVESDLAATVAGEALARLGGPEAEQAVLGAHSRFGSETAYWVHVRPLLSPDAGALADATPTSAVALRDRGVRRAQKHDFESAIADFTSAIAIDPRDHLAWYNRGLARYETHDLDGALVDMTKALALSPEDTGFLQTRALVRRDRGDLDGALEDLDRALELDPQDKATLSQRGNVRRMDGDLPGAIADLTSAIALAPDYQTAWINRGIARRAARDLAGAIADYDRALALDPRSATALGNRALCYQERGDPAHALADFTAALEVEPRNYEARHGRGVVAMKLGDLDAAIADFDKAIALKPRALPAWQQRGQAYADKGELVLAVADFTRVIELTPRSPLGWNDRGVARELLHDFVGAHADFTQAIALSPRMVRALFNRGGVRHRLGDLRGALEDLDRTTAVDPKFAPAIMQRGEIRLAQGELELAAKDLERAVALTPDDATTWVALERLHIARHERREAIAACTRVIELSPGNADGWCERGSLRIDEGEGDAGIADLDHAIELNPRLAVAFGNRGSERLRRGDRAGGKADLTRYLELAPDGLDADKARRVLADLGSPGK